MEHRIGPENAFDVLTNTALHFTQAVFSKKYVLESKMARFGPILG